MDPVIYILDTNVIADRFNQMKGIIDFHEAWENRGYECVDISFSKNRRCGRQTFFGFV